MCHCQGINVFIENILLFVIEKQVMLRVQSLDHNIITGTFRVENCMIAGPNTTECGVGQHLMGECGRVETLVCGMRENKGVLTLGNLNRARVRLTPKAQFV